MFQQLLRQPPAGRAQAHHREVQVAVQGRSCISGTGHSRCNVILKELGRQCGFKIRLTYHVARHETVSLFDSGEGSPAPSALHVRVVLPISMSAGIACPFLGRNGLS